MKILIVLTSHRELGNTGKKSGFWVEEFVAPHHALKDAGDSITIASPTSGIIKSRRKLLKLLEEKK